MKIATYCSYTKLASKFFICGSFQKNNTVVLLPLYCLNPCLKDIITKLPNVQLRHKPGQLEALEAQKP